MTLEEAIKHCEEKACGNSECAKEHRQLAEWLKKLLKNYYLKRRKENSMTDKEKIREQANIDISNLRKQEIIDKYVNLKDNKAEKIIEALKEGFKYHQLFNPTFGGIPCTAIVDWLEQQSEQKYSDKVEQKSTWSKKDEKLLELSLDNFTELKNRFGDGYGKVGDCMYWLKSLKNRIKRTI